MAPCRLGVPHAGLVRKAPITEPRTQDTVTSPKNPAHRSGQLDTAELLEMMRASCSDDEAMRKQVGEGDVAFVLEHCDTDGDKKIARDEVLPMLAIWRELVEDIKERHVSSGNLLGADGKQPGAKASKSSSISCALL